MVKKAHAKIQSHSQPRAAPICRPDRAQSTDGGTLAKSRARQNLPIEERRLHKLAALRQFLEDVEESRALFDSDHRKGCTNALIATQLFLNALDPNATRDGLRLPFNTMTQAFLDLEAGGAPNLFRSKRKRGRRPTPVAEHNIRTTAVRFVEELAKRCDSGASPEHRREQAARDVAGLLRRHRFPLGKGRVTSDWRVVLGWRENLSKDRSGDYARSLHKALSDRFPVELGYQDLLGALGEILTAEWSSKER